jgi:hypothetical protein
VYGDCTKNRSKKQAMHANSRMENDVVFRPQESRISLLFQNYYSKESKRYGLLLWYMSAKGSSGAVLCLDKSNAFRHCHGPARVATGSVVGKEGTLVCVHFLEDIFLS